MSDYFSVSGNPVTGALGSSADIRAEFALVSDGFDKLPDFTAVANRVVHVNSGSTALVTTSGFTFDGTTFTAPALAVTNASTFTGAVTCDGAVTLGNAAADAHTLNGVMTAGTAAQILLDDSITSAGANLPIAFEGDANTGFFRPGADILAGATGGTEHWRHTLAGFSKFSSIGTYVGAAGENHEFVSGTAFATSNEMIIIRNTHASDAAGLSLHFSSDTPDDNTTWFFKCYDATATRCLIYSDGDLQNHDNSYGAISDERLKQDIKDAGSQWDDIKNLRVRKYRFISDVIADADAKQHIGVIAQEVRTISPGLVTHDKNSDHYGIQYSVLYMKAIKALQETMARVEMLERR